MAGSNRLTLLQAQPLRQTACHDVADHDFDRHDRDLLREHFPIAQPLDEMRGHPGLLQQPKEPLETFVIDDALSRRSFPRFCALNAVASSLKYWTT